MHQRDNLLRSLTVTAVIDNIMRVIPAASAPVFCFSCACCVNASCRPIAENIADAEQLLQPLGPACNTPSEGHRLSGGGGGDKNRKEQPAY